MSMHAWAIGGSPVTPHGCPPCACAEHCEVSARYHRMLRRADAAGHASDVPTGGLAALARALPEPETFGPAFAPAGFAVRGRAGRRPARVDRRGVPSGNNARAA
ncbi:hypothetical protein BGLA2_1710013 [Burkholderia gladioli]|jgi:hypothetical protein|nr:hypothetical protein BGLA2_1710013 [Burkholderia gladioli]